MKTGTDERSEFIQSGIEVIMSSTTNCSKTKLWMALWFFTLFVWYGVVTELQQVNCFRNTGSGCSSSEKIFGFPFKNTTDSSYIQRKEGFVGVKHHEGKPQDSSDENNNKQVAAAIQIRRKDNQLVIHKRRFKRTLQNKYLKKHNNSQQINIKSNPHPVVPHVEIFYNANVSVRNRKNRASAAEKIKNSRYKRQFQFRIPRFKRERFSSGFVNLIAQVPDDDTVYDDSKEESDETNYFPPEDVGEIPKSARYFYRNNRRILVSNDEEESDKYYKEQNKGSEDDGGLRPDQTQSKLERSRQLLETALHKDDALEESIDVGPTFKNSMTWVNMMRASRGWFPKGTYP